MHEAAVTTHDAKPLLNIFVLLVLLLLRFE